MRIAIIAPIIESIPPQKYGGTERVVHILTEKLVQRGHNVTLFATGDSDTSARLFFVANKSIREMDEDDIYGFNVKTLMNIGNAYNLQENFDVIHDHNGYLGLPTAQIVDTPVVVTQHGPFTKSQKRIYRLLNRPCIVSISKSQGQQAKGLNHIGTVHNGLDMSHYPFSNGNDGYLLFVGRISKEKGVHSAIKVAKEVGLPLVIAAKLDDTVPREYRYFKKEVEPKLGGDIEWVGEVGEQKRNKLMSEALCILHPITWSEPFGLTLIEAMACGCPAVAIGMGSIPEVVSDGHTGYVVNNTNEMVDAVKKIDTIDRAECRRYALSTFSGDRMADGYEHVYKKILQKEIENKRWATQNRMKISIGT